MADDQEREPGADPAQPAQPAEYGDEGFAEGQERSRSSRPTRSSVRDFGEGQEDFPESPEEEHIGRFSEGQEEEPETPEKVVERDFAEGQEERPPGERLADLGARPVQRRRKIVGQRRGDVDRRARERLGERQARGVEELALEAEPPGRPVLGVADHRMADRLQVDADLVRAAGLEAHAQERRARQRLLDLEVRDAPRAASSVSVDIARAHAPVAADRRVDRARPRRRAALDEREVLAGDLARLQRAP